VDNLHEAAGSSHVFHLHGELMKSRSTADPNLVYPIEGWELGEGDLCEMGCQLRPHIVWFGEMVDAMPEAERLVRKADALVVVGTSLQVYPAAGLAWCAPSSARHLLIDPHPPSAPDFEVIEAGASKGLAQASKLLGLPVVQK
jgi:NAD-dependent deacetylase